MPVTSAVKRAMDISVKALNDKGFKTVEVNIPDNMVSDCKDVMLGILSHYMMGPLLGRLRDNYEQPLPCYKLGSIFVGGSFFLRTLFLSLLKLTGNKRVVRTTRFFKILSEEEVKYLILRQKSLYKEMAQLWKDAGVEALVMPIFPSCSFKAVNSGDLGGLFDYCALWSSLHYPQGVIPPVTLVTPEDEEY